MEPGAFLRFALLLLLFPVYCLLSTVYCPSSHASDWPAFLGDAAHSGYTSNPAAPPLTQAWEFNAGNAIHSSPSKAGYLVFIGAANGALHAVHEQTGNEVWSFAADGIVVSAPAVSGDRVVFTTKKGNAYALRLSSGEMIWSRDLGGDVLSSSAIAGGRVFISVGEPANKVAALSLDTGATLWEFAAGQPFYSTPAVSGSMLWVGCDDGVFYGLDTAAGALAASFTTGGLIYTSSPAIANGVVFGAAGEYDMNVYAFNSQTGALVWQSAPFAGDAIVKISSVIANGGMVYLSIGYPQQKLAALNAADGQLVWQAALGDLTGLNFAPSPAVAGNTLYVSSADGTLHAFDAATGASLGAVALGGPTVASPAVADGMVFISTRDGKLIAYLGSDASPPTASIVSPGATVSGTVSLTGAANDDSFKSYVLDYGAGASPSEWTTIYYSTLPVENGALAAWYTNGVPDGEYTLRLTVTDNSGNTSAATAALAVDNTPPAFSGILSALDAATGGGAALSWPEATDPHTPITYYVFQSTTSGLFDYDAPAATTTQTQLLIGNLATGTTYYFAVRAADAVGNTDGNIAVASVTPTTADTAAPSFAGIATATANTDGTVALAWDAASDPSAPITYRIHQSTASGVFDFNSPAATTTQTQLLIGNLASGTTYYFSVRAADAAGNADANTIQIAATTPSPEQPPAPDTAPPSFAGIVSAIPGANSSITITYNPASDPSAPITYRIYQATVSGGHDGFSTPTYTASQTTFVTGPLTPGANYFFTVRAVDSAGNEDANTVEMSAAPASVSGPAIAITSPQNAALLNAPNIIVTGTTAPSATLTMNGNAVIVSLSGAFSAAATLTEGNNTLSFIAADADGNTSALALTLTLDTTPPAVAITSPAADGTVTGAVTITGAVSDARLAGYRLEYGPTAAPVAWSKISESSSGAASGALGAWNASSFGGVYSLRLTATDTAGNSAVATASVTASNTITIAAVLPAGAWGMLSLPMLPNQTAPKTVFGESGYKIIRWDPLKTDPDPNALNYISPGELAAGAAFFIKPYNGDIAYTITGKIPDTTADFSVSLHNGWNQIGSPFDREFNIGTLKVRKGNDTYSFDAAAAAGLVAPVLFSYENNGYSQNSSAFNMGARAGYFLKAYDEIALLFDPAAPEPLAVSRASAKIVRPRLKTLKISARAAGLSDDDNLLGISPDGDDGRDPKDAEEPPRGADRFLSLYFAPSEPERSAERFANDVRLPPAGSKDWLMKIDTSETGAVTVSWDASELAAGNYTATLKDNDTGAAVNMLETSSYSYTPTAGAPHSFTITVTAGGAGETATVSRALSPGWNLVSFPIEPTVTNALVQLGDDIAGMNVFQFHDRTMYSPDDTEGVDIQAGIGYWIYVDGNVTVDIEGAPTDTTVPIRVPLARGWNLIGDPYALPLAWGDNISLSYSGVVKTLSEAAALGWTDGRLFEYAGGAYAEVPAGSSMEPWKGYFLKTGVPCELIIKY